MKKIILSALVAGAAIYAVPASAQDVTGTVNLSGSVAPKCLVVPSNGDTYTDSINFGELAGPDGTLRSGLDTDFNAKAFAFRVVCTTPDPTVSVDADPLATTTAADTGYDNSIDYTATVTVTTTGTNAGPFANASDTPAGTATAIGSRLANNGGNNVAISASNFHTNNPTDLLVAANDYAGKITVVIAPGA